MKWMQKYINQKVEYLGKIFTVTHAISYGGERLLELNGMNPFVTAGKVKIISK